MEEKKLIIDFDNMPPAEYPPIKWGKARYCRVIEPKPGKRMLTYEETEELGRRLRGEAENPPTEEA